MHHAVKNLQTMTVGLQTEIPVPLLMKREANKTGGQLM
jgi:hypothetical protein